MGEGIPTCKVRPHKSLQKQMTTREGEVSSGRLYCKESAAQLGASIRIYVLGGGTNLVFQLGR